MMMCSASPREWLRVLTALLGAEAREVCGALEIDQVDNKEKEKQFTSLFEGDKDRVQCSLPSLSLAHEDHLNFNQKSLDEVEESAFQLLSRPMGFEADAAALCSSKLLEVSRVLLMNTSESFALLVDSNLRAHATFMAKHSQTAAKNSVQQDNCTFGIDRKLQTLLDLGNRVTASQAKTTFQIIEVLNQGETQENKFSSAITFLTCMKLSTQSLSGAPGPSVSIRYETRGSLYVSRDTGVCSVSVEIDSKALLAQMKTEAAKVVSQVIEMTNSVFAAPSAVPAPKNQTKRHLPGSALVSPDISACFSRNTNVPHLMLDGDDASETSDLSPDQCEHILDDVFEDIDVNSFSVTRDISPPKKKARMTK